MEKRPRQYAFEIIGERDRDKRKAMLSEVPEHLRDLVKKHVEVAWQKLKANN